MPGAQERWNSMKRESVWQQSTVIPGRPELPGNLSTDVAVIGGGLAGILTAHFLEQSGRQCVVLEANRIGSGQTGHTTAKVTSQHGPIYQKLMKYAGRKQAEQYARINQEAIERYKILIEKYHIDCEWEECPACLYTKENGKALRDEYYAAKEPGASGRTETGDRASFCGRRGAVLLWAGMFPSVEIFAGHGGKSPDL